MVGDFNISPSAIDCCDPRPGFDRNPYVFPFPLVMMEFDFIPFSSLRQWLRSLLREFGGSFVDVFRDKHPIR